MESDQFVIEKKDFEEFADSIFGIKSKNILVAAFHEWPEHLGSFLEVIEVLDKSNHNVFVGLWSDQTPFADASRIYPDFMCKLLGTTNPQIQAKYILTEKCPNVTFVSLGTNSKQKRYLFPRKRNLHFRELQAYYVEPPGKGVAISSTLIGWTRRSEQVAVFNNKVVNLLSDSYDFVFENSQSVINSNSIDSIVLFNGRFVHEHALLQAAIKLNKEILFYEAGGTDGNFDLYTHETLDKHKIQTRMMDEYKTNPSPVKTQYASIWFSDRKNRKNLEVRNFTKNQKIGKSLLHNKNQKILVYFSTSSDELLYSNDKDISDFGTQEEFLHGLINLIQIRNDYQLVIRTHPNMKNKSRKTQKLWNKFIEQHSNVIHLRANSEIDSYELMLQADKIIVFGSTIGIEAAFANQDVISVAESFYDELGAVPKIVSFREIDDWLSGKFSKRSSSIKSEPFGFFSRNRGFAFKNYLPKDSGYGLYGNLPIGLRFGIRRKLIALENRIRTNMW